jgi:adenylate cyclase, class 2
VIEAELKADVRDPQSVLEDLRARATEERCIYRDTYYETPGRGLASEGREIRLRTIVGSDTRHVLTFKEAAVDEASDSKPEYETRLDDRDAVEHLLTALGLSVDIAFEKHCRNYRFNEHGLDFLATLVRVPEIGDDTFLEIETLVAAEHDVPLALAAIRSVLTSLGIDPATELNHRYYQDVVIEHRRVGASETS